LGDCVSVMLGKMGEEYEAGVLLPFSSGL
jgi:hypothetical protein